MLSDNHIGSIVDKLFTLEIEFALWFVTLRFGCY